MAGNAITVQIGADLVDRVVRFEQTKAFANHTVAVLDVTSPKWQGRVTPEVAPEWTPVVLRLSSGSESTNWYGYVHHGGLAFDVREVTGPVVRYTLIGTSLPMNEQRTRSWKNTSASALVRQIAKEHRLRTLITPSRTVLPYYAQAGSSDFKTLQDLALTTGFRLYVDGATVTFVDGSLLLEGVRSADVPTFTQSRASTGNTVYDFVSKVGTMVPRSNGPTARQVVMGVDPRSKRVVTATSSTNLGAGSPIGTTPMLTTVNTSTRVASQMHAQDVANAGATNTRGWLTATAVVVGSPTLVPGSVVNLAGSALPVDQTGLWLVTSVTHRVLRDKSNPYKDFTTTLELERDQYYAPSFRTDFKTINTQDSVAATIRNGVYWESDLMEDINVG